MMNTEILEFKNRHELEQALINALCEERAIINISFFFDQFSETHKAVISFYE